MTVRDALREGAAALAGTETPFLDASLLLADALGTDSSRLLASGPDPLAPAAAELYRARLEARSRGRPVAYLLGYKEFYGRRFSVDERVLVPRPDTETLVEAALKLGDAILSEENERKNATAKTQREEKNAEKRIVGGSGMGRGSSRLREQSPPSPLFSASSSGSSPRLCACIPLRVHEVCTGSGCVAITLAAERPEWIVSASDVSEEALEVARANAAALLGPDGGGRPGGPLALARSDLLAAVSGSFDLIVANPPYVPAGEAARLLGLGWSEPRIALDGGDDGLDIARLLVPQAAESLAPGGWLLVEADGAQAPAMAELFRASRFESVEAALDLGGRPRVTAGRKPWTS